MVGQKLTAGNPGDGEVHGEADQRHDDAQGEEVIPIVPNSEELPLEALQATCRGQRLGITDKREALPLLMSASFKDG